MRQPARRRDNPCRLDSYPKGMNMTDQEINRKLAQAIGWKRKQMRSYGGAVFVLNRCWCLFSHRHWHTIGPIAQRYDCFPRLDDRHWYAKTIRANGSYADTPQQAIALAVIAAHEAGVLE